MRPNADIIAGGCTEDLSDLAELIEQVSVPVETRAAYLPPKPVRYEELRDISLATTAKLL